jgi:hypothetical protein
MPAMWTEEYQRHFQHYFNKPFDIQVYHGPDGAALKLATYDWALAGFRVYASMGLADRLTLEDDDGAFGEVILYADVPDAIVPKLFVNALFFILQHGIPLDSRFAVSFAGMDRRFAARIEKSAFYFTRAFSADDEFDHVTESARVYQAFFITPEEDEFLDKNGPDAFEEKFWAQVGGDITVRPPIDLKEMDAFEGKMFDLREKAVRLFSLRRPSCV